MIRLVIIPKYQYYYLSSIATPTTRSPFLDGVTTQHQKNVRSMIKNIEFKFGRAFDKKSDSKTEQKYLDSSKNQNEMIEENKRENNGKDSPINIPIENKGAHCQADSNTFKAPSNSLSSGDKNLKFDPPNLTISPGSECTFRKPKSTSILQDARHRIDTSSSSLLNNDGNLKRLSVKYIPDIIQQLVSDIIKSWVIFSISKVSRFNVRHSNFDSSRAENYCKIIIIHLHTWRIYTF